VVVEENRSSADIIGRKDAPFLNSLARTGLNFTQMHAERHPSQPNYVALLSGSTQGLTSDSCPHLYKTANLVSQLLGHGLSFAGYSESLPNAGYTGCAAYPYARKHVPWTDFTNIPHALNKPLTAMPTDYAHLPDVSFVIPNLLDDMHDGSVMSGDTWLRNHLGGYASWARTHHSLLLVTWDEDDGTKANHIPTIAVGDGIKPGTWSQWGNHYALLAALERSFGLPRLGGAAHVAHLPPIT
jgi:acid phosphatase